MKSSVWHGGAELTTLDTDGAPAVAAYREVFQPSPPSFADGRDRHHALAADTVEEAERLAAMTCMPVADAPGGEAGEAGVRCRIRGDGSAGPAAYLNQKIRSPITAADELFVMSAGPTLASRIRSLELIAEKP